MTMPTLALFTPYSLVAGGGERYLLSIAQVFRGEFEVFLVTPDEQPRARLELLGQDLDVQVDHVVPIRLLNALERAPFDVAIVMGNEALPLLPALGHRNIFLCQFPFPTDRNELTLRLAFWPHYERVVVYSEYARAHAQQNQIKITPSQRPLHIIHPPVSPVRATNASIAKKPGMIVSVGRFASAGHNKRQDKLIAAFRQICQPGVSLHLAGNVPESQDGQDTYGLCRDLAKDLPVTFHPNATRAEIGQLYAESDCYWHGAGLDADSEMQAEKFEHFGITVVEAMASGCIPFVLNHGGPASIVSSGRDGWTYGTIAELATLTSRFLSSTNSDAVDTMRVAARRRAEEYSFEVFRDGWKKLIAVGDSTELSNTKTNLTEPQPHSAALGRITLLCELYQAELGHITAYRDHYQAELGPMTASRDYFQAELGRMTDARDQYRMELDRITATANILQEENIRLTTSLTAANADLQRIFQSKSWQLTAPLRLLLAKVQQLSDKQRPKT